MRAHFCLPRKAGRADRFSTQKQLLTYAALCGAALSGTALAEPFIFNAPHTARPGDYISLTGLSFGPNPQVFMKPATDTNSFQVQGPKSVDIAINFELPKINPLTQKLIPFTQYDVWTVNPGFGASHSHVYINAPRAMHFDFPQVASSSPLRIFGRNLYLGAGAFNVTPSCGSASKNDGAPTVCFVDQATNATLPAKVTGGDMYSLTITTPAGLVPGKTYNVKVSNGYGFNGSDGAVVAEQTITARAGGADPFGLGAPWAADFAPLSANKYDVKTSTALTLRAKGDGVANDAPAIQAAIDLATKKGGIVYLPAGTYNVGGAGSAVIGLILRPNVVLQGHSSADTKIVFGPNKPMGSSYFFFGIYTNPATKLAGIADLSLQNIDKTSQKVVNLAMNDAGNSEIFLQRVNWDLGSGESVALAGERIAVENSSFRQAANSQQPFATGQSGEGPLILMPSTNMIFSGNTVWWASGDIKMIDMTNGIVENNHFTRSASDQIVAGPAQTSWPSVGKKIAVGDIVQRTPGRQIAADFGTNSVIQNNIFDTADGVIKYNWNDGETILSEAGNAHDREDSGSVTAAQALSVTDSSRGSNAWHYDSTKPHVLVIVNGMGGGEWRNIVKMTGNTFYLDKPLDIYPAAGDRFIIAQPSYLNVIIRNNMMSGNPFGVAMYDGTFLNVSVTGNKLTDNGGIYLSPDQEKSGMAGPGQTGTKFSIYRNIEINNNIVTDKSGYYPAYIQIFFRLVNQTTLFGRSVEAVEVRNNQVTARSGTKLDLFPFASGYGAWLAYQYAGAPYVETKVKLILGAVFQGDSCVNCPVNYKLTGGDSATVIWNATSPNTNGFQSTFMTDMPIWSSTKVTSTATIVGKD